MAGTNSTSSKHAYDNEHGFKSMPSWAWDNRLAKGYIGGNEIGKAAAVAYLKFAELRESINGGSLQHPAIDMAERLAKTSPGSEEWDVIKGQMVGVFSTIDRLFAQQKVKILSI